MTDKRTPTDRGLERRWKTFDWNFAEATLARYQREISVAAFSGDWEAISRAQKRLVRSIEAKALAVRHVCDAVSQAGIDGVKWVSGAEKMKAALSLDSKGYEAKPTRMVVVRQKGKPKDRHVQMPTYYDRAMQTLYAYALDPVSESTADRRSFAFRKGRSQFDVHAFIMKAYDSNPNPPLYIVKADVKACYASICHDWLLNNIPMDSKVLKQFLKAGHILNGELFPSDDFGISLGSSLSPILGNMTLDGAQRAVQNALHGGDEYIDFADGDMIRYADDILFTARTRESAEAIIEILSTFLAVRGLVLSEHKTHIIKATDGFEFLSRYYKLFEGFMHSEPTEAAVMKMENSMRDLIAPYRGGQKTLIVKINKKLTGWATYHKITNATMAFRHIDNAVKALLLELCEKLNPLMSRSRIISKYFYMDTDGEYVYALENKPDERVVRLKDTVLVKHQPVSIKKHPYLYADYYEERTDNRAIMAVTGKYKPIWKRQKGKCYYCGNRILTDELHHAFLLEPRQKGIECSRPDRYPLARYFGNCLHNLIAVHWTIQR
jgi:RNA-directed DNA polymerase